MLQLPRLSSLPCSDDPMSLGQQQAPFRCAQTYTPQHGAESHSCPSPPFRNGQADADLAAVIPPSLSASFRILFSTTVLTVH